MGTLRGHQRSSIARFDPAHDSRVEDKNAYQFGIHGYPVNRPEQPVVRVSWQRGDGLLPLAVARRPGERFTLPTEAQWEYACRAGTATPILLRRPGRRFLEVRQPGRRHAHASSPAIPYTVDTPLTNPTKYDDWIPKDARFNDGGAADRSTPGRYQPNAWGLCDMHGNVAEWTRTTYRPYPYRTDDGRNDPAAGGRKVVRGGSWRDRPRRATSSFRLSYLPYQRVYNVGFRVVCEPRTRRWRWHARGK